MRTAEALRALAADRHAATRVLAKRTRRPAPQMEFVFRTREETDGAAPLRARLRLGVAAGRLPDRRPGLFRGHGCCWCGRCAGSSPASPPSAPRPSTAGRWNRCPPTCMANDEMAMAGRELVGDAGGAAQCTVAQRAAGRAGQRGGADQPRSARHPVSGAADGGAAAEPPDAAVQRAGEIADAHGGPRDRPGAADAGLRPRGAAAAGPGAGGAGAAGGRGERGGGAGTSGGTPECHAFTWRHGPQLACRRSCWCRRTATSSSACWPTCCATPPMRGACRPCVSAAEAGRGTATIDVADDGPGLPDAVRATLFRPFARSTRHDGAGLGLAIARDLTLAHGGEIALASSGPRGHGVPPDPAHGTAA